MTDETNVQTSAAAESPITPPTESLETIAKEIPVDEQANQFTARPAVQYPTYAPPQPYIPDPVTDQEGYRRFVSEQIQASSTVGSALNELKTEIQSFKHAQEKAQLDADVNRAVEAVNTKLKVDPLLAEAMLEMTYKRDPNFQKIWNNRGKNPQALERALNVVAEKLIPLVNVRQDPQLAENVRAARQSQNTMGTTKTPSQNDGIPTDPNEFQRYWQRLVTGN